MHRKTFFMGKPLIIAAAALCLGTAAQATEIDKSAKAAAPAVSKAATDTIAVVNGVKIPTAEFERAQKAFMSTRPGMQIPPERKKDFETSIINQLISAELLYQGGQKLEVKDLETRVNNKIAEGKKRFATEAEFENTLKGMGITMADLRDYTRRDTIISNFLQTVIVAKITISDDEAKQFYEKNIDKFKKDETIKASHILISVEEKASEAYRKAAREKAEKLHKEIAGGADFAELAKKNSTCPSSQQGGDLGYFGKGQMVPPFEKAAFAMKTGDVSNVVETQFGYHIIKLTDRKGAETMAFNDVKERLKDYLKGLKVNDGVKAYLAETRKTAKIEILHK